MIPVLLGNNGILILLAIVLPVIRVQILCGFIWIIVLVVALHPDRNPLIVHYNNFGKKQPVLVKLLVVLVLNGPVHLDVLTVYQEHVSAQRSLLRQFVMRGLRGVQCVMLVNQHWLYQQ